MISTLKYDLLQRILGWGYSVLVVDLDVVFLKDPFEHLYRDADVEGSTDGFTRNWAMGSLGSVHEPKMGWGAGGLYVQHFTLNVGCAFFRPTPNAIELLRRVGSRLARERVGPTDLQPGALPQVARRVQRQQGERRVMDHLKWVNSKVYFSPSAAASSPAGPPGPAGDGPHELPRRQARMLCVWAYGPKGETARATSSPRGGTWFEPLAQSWWNRKSTQLPAPPPSPACRRPWAAARRDARAGAHRASCVAVNQSRRRRRRSASASHINRSRCLPRHPPGSRYTCSCTSALPRGDARLARLARRPPPTLLQSINYSLVGTRNPASHRPSPRRRVQTH